MRQSFYCVTHHVEDLFKLAAVDERQRSPTVGMMGGDTKVLFVVRDCLATSEKSPIIKEYRQASTSRPAVAIHVVLNASICCQQGHIRCWSEN